ncbi:MAG: hypothetical protein HUU01_14140 [Saprospiraceae bacterium]|nr:hypothetical protein [Saprospiraceae bacterium]
MTKSIAQKPFKMAYLAQLYANGIDPESVAPLYGSLRMQSVKLSAPETIQFGQLMLFASVMGATPLELYKEYGVARETLSETEVQLLELLEEFINQNRQLYEQTLGRIREFATESNAGASAKKASPAALPVE